MMDDLISKKSLLSAYDEKHKGPAGGARKLIEDAPSIPAVPLDKLCELLAEMYHCPSSGWPSSGRACHPGCPDEAFEKLCGTDCDKHTDVERWEAFLTAWMEGLDGNK